MLGFERAVSHSRKGREDQGEGVPMDYVKVWAHGFAQQEGKTEGRGHTWWCSSPAKVAKPGGSDGRPSRRRWVRVARTLGKLGGLGASSGAVVGLDGPLDCPVRPSLSWSLLRWYDSERPGCSDCRETSTRPTSGDFFLFRK
jgi:hypothetical protein